MPPSATQDSVLSVGACIQLTAPLGLCGPVGVGSRRRLSTSLSERCCATARSDGIIMPLQIERRCYRGVLCGGAPLRLVAASAGCNRCGGGGCARVLEDPTTRPRRVATAAATPPSGCSTPRPTCHRGRSRGCSGCAVMSGECAAVAPWRGQLAAGVGEIDGAFPNSPRSPMHRLAAPPRGKRDVDNL